MIHEDTIDSLLIKNWLQQGPKIPLTDKPLFKLIWSDDEYELRTGLFAKFVGSVKVSEALKTEKVLKYNWIHNRWILEQWFGPEVTALQELPESVNGSFEPLYVFEGKDGQVLPLNLQVVQLIVKTCLQPHKSAAFKKSLAQARADAREKQAENLDFEILQDEGPLISQFHDGSAILAPGFSDKNKIKEDEIQ